MLNKKDLLESEKILSKKWPHAISVAGGTHSTNITAELLTTHSLDYVVRGEAEDSFAELLQLIAGENTKEAHAIKGVYSRKVDFNKEHPKISEYPILENLPFFGMVSTLKLKSNLRLDKLSHKAFLK